MRNGISEIGLTALSFALITLMGLIVLQVLFSALDVNPVATFEAAWPVLGKSITLNSLLDAQWHLLVIIGLMPAGLVWLMDRHVRVDFFYQQRSPRWQAGLNLLGNVVFAAPFFAMSIQASWNFAARAWQADESSRNAGLNDLWLIKSVLPLGLSLLALAVLIEALRLLREVR